MKLVSNVDLNYGGFFYRAGQPFEVDEATATILIDLHGCKEVSTAKPPPPARPAKPRAARKAIGD